MRSLLPALTCAALLSVACDATGRPDDIRVGSYGATSSDVRASSTRFSETPPEPGALATPDAIVAASKPMPAASSSAAQATQKGPLPTVKFPNQPFASTAVAQFDQPWAMVFLPDGRLLVTQKPGQLKLCNPVNGQIGAISGIPSVAYGGQGGLGDVVLHPQFASNGLVYFSYAEAGPNDTRGAAVARAQLTLDAAGGGALSGLQVLWRQVPKVTGEGHFGHRLAFDTDGKLWITSGDRQKFDPAQDMQSNLGKLLRLNDDG